MNNNKLVCLYLSSCIAMCASNIREEILVVVNSHIITRKMFQQEVNNYCRNNKDKAISTSSYLTREVALQNLINSCVLIDKANDIGITVSDDVLHIYIEDLKKENGFTSNNELELAIRQDLGVEFKDFLHNSKQEMIKREVILREVLVQPFISDQEPREYYEKHKGEYQKIGRFHIRELALPKGTTQEERRVSEKKLTEIQERLKLTGNFEPLIKTYSIAPSSSSGGDLGWVDASILHPELRAALLTLSTNGQLTAPIEIGNNIYLIQLIEAERNEIQPYEEVQLLIREKLKSIKIQKDINTYLDSLKSRAEIRYVIPKEIILSDKI